MIRVLLIKTPYLNTYGGLKNVASSYFPIGLGYIASVLRNSGFEVNILDPEVNSMNENAIRTVIRSFSPHVVGISCATPNIFEARDLAKIVKQETCATVVLGGPHASSLPSVTLEQLPEFDIVVYGEGEFSMLELCQVLKEGREQMQTVKGIAYRSNGVVLVNESRPWIRDLDQLPFPARDLLDIFLYKPQTNMERGKKSAVIITSRGCPFRCTFCASHRTAGRIFRSHSPQYVISEMEHLIKNYGIEYFLIQDDEFTTNPQRIKKICQMIIDSGMKIEWWCHSRVDTVTEELLLLMRKAGCVHISYGIESGNESILNNYQKGISLEQCRQTLKVSNRLGLKTHCFFIFGHMNETKQTIEQSIRFAIELAPTMSSFAMLVPYPGTEEFERANLNLRDINIWKDFVTVSGTPVISSKSLSKKRLQVYIAKAYMRFYFRPIQLMRILKNLSSFEELKAYNRGGLALLHQIVDWMRG